jgi:hypothetical protein
MYQETSPGALLRTTVRPIIIAILTIASVGLIACNFIYGMELTPWAEKLIYFTFAVLGEWILERPVLKKLNKE